MLFCHITTRIPGEKNDDLLTKKGGRGFPHLVYMDAEGEVMGQPAGRSVEAFATGAGFVKTYVELKGKEGRSKDEEVRLLVAEVKLGKLKFAQAEARKKAIEGLDEEQTKTLDAMFVDLRIMDILERGNPQTAEAAAAVGKSYYALYQEGVRPIGDQAFGPFYGLIMEYGKSQGDADIFEIGLTAMKEKFGSNPRAKRFLDSKEAELQKLRGK